MDSEMGSQMWRQGQKDILKSNNKDLFGFKTASTLNKALRHRCSKEYSKVICCGSTLIHTENCASLTDKLPL